MRALTAVLALLACAAAIQNLSLYRTREANQQVIVSLEAALAAATSRSQLGGAALYGELERVSPRPAVAIYAAAPSDGQAAQTRAMRRAGNQPGLVSPQRRNEMARVQIEALADGPYVIRGTAAVVGADGSLREHAGSSVALCRCGRSGNAPFCDGRHRQNRFQAAARTLLVDGEA